MIELEAIMSLNPTLMVIDRQYFYFYFFLIVFKLLRVIVQMAQELTQIQRQFVIIYYYSI